MFQFENDARPAPSPLRYLRHTAKKGELQARISNKSIPRQQGSSPTGAFGAKQHCHYSLLTFV
ncbi:MAG: hypothetical protein NTZ72_17355 [Afipia sp.]|jgi:hypothetical protein|nr:hypothetical protein [Afipia sp.]